MKKIGRYDSALQMFVEEPRELNLQRLNFLKWLVENGRLEQGMTLVRLGEMSLSTAGQGFAKEGQGSVRPAEGGVHGGGPERSRG